MRRFLLALAVLRIALALPALSVPEIVPLGPDSQEVRLALVDTWFARTLEELRSWPAETRTTSKGDVFQIRIIEDKSEGSAFFDVEIVPRSQVEVDVYSSEGTSAVVGDTYSTETPGTWVLRRSTEDALPRELRCVLARNLVLVWTFPPPGKPSQIKTASLSLRLFDSYIIRDRPVGISFERLSVASQTTLQGWFPTVPWHLAKAMPEHYGDTLQMIGVIRRNLPRIVIVEDAAYGTDDRSYSVMDGLPRSPPLSKGGQGGLELSNAGFVKWIVDGIVRPLAGNNILIPPVLQSTGNATGGTERLLSTRYNLRFALDWCRNLADAVDAVTNGRIGRQVHSNTDVAIEPLATASATVFLPDTGYQAQSLQAILYILAATEPDTFYLAAIRETDRDAVPEVSFYNTAAAIFPYFTAAGSFDAVVFEGGTEMSLAAFLKKYPASFIHLSRVASSAYFFPQ